jgi:AraC-like DNA-binding protein
MKTMTLHKVDFVKEHLPAETGWNELARRAHFRPGELSTLSGMAPRRLHRVFLRVFGCPPRDWLEERKLRAAKRMLASGEPAKIVAAALGFAHVPNFYRWLRSQQNT